MPYSLWASGPITSNSKILPRQLVPGVVPGGQRAGGATKPVLLIHDAWARWLDFTDTGTTVDSDQAYVALLLSQEQSLDPAQVLYVEEVALAKTATANLWNQIRPRNVFRLHRGTFWAPKFVGIWVVPGGATLVKVDVTVHYDIVDVPWRDWFMMWEWLDNVESINQEY